jgi:hypothetical protein
MKRFLLICLLSSAALLACTGDCLTCHPALEANIHKDERHKPMLGCINCHSPDPEKAADCGSDCFGCHPIEKIDNANVREHDVIRKCRDCHMRMKEELFNLTTPKEQSTAKPLKELLLP